MKIDVVIGTIMHKQIQLNMLPTIAHKYTVLMVPKQKLFEQLNNKPIKEVYYPIQRDIIEQQILCGVQLVQFDMQHKKNTSTALKTIVKDSSIYKSTEFITDCTMLQSYSDRVRSIIQKCNVGNDITSITLSNRKHGEYSLYIDKRIRGVKSIADSKQSCVIGEQLIINNQDKQAKKDIVDKASQVEMFSGCKRNCESLQSYISTKLVRFLVYLGVTKYNISQETWRYVKCPKDLEHIYTDKELYDYYHLTLDEIRIIEDTILDMSDIRHRSELSYDKILERTFKILDTWCEDVENLVFVLEELVSRIVEYKEENN